MVTAVTIYKSSDGTPHEASLKAGALLGLGEADIEDALTRAREGLDNPLGDAIEAFAGKISAARRKAGVLKRKPNGASQDAAA